MDDKAKRQANREKLRKARENYDKAVRPIYAAYREAIRPAEDARDEALQVVYDAYREEVRKAG